MWTNFGSALLFFPSAGRLRKQSCDWKQQLCTAPIDKLAHSLCFHRKSISVRIFSFGKPDERLDNYEVIHQISRRNSLPTKLLLIAFSLFLFFVCLAKKVITGRSGELRKSNNQSYQTVCMISSFGAVKFLLFSSKIKKPWHWRPSSRSPTFASRSKSFKWNNKRTQLEVKSWVRTFISLHRFSSIVSW